MDVVVDGKFILEQRDVSLKWKGSTNQRVVDVEKIIRSRQCGAARLGGIMKRIAKFHKVSEEQFLEGWKDAFPGTEEATIKSIYENIKLPKRATAGSAGYDFFSPVDFELKPGETLKMPTGIRAEMELGWVLKIYPRSGLGFKYRLQLNNTVGIIDSDYFYSDNEGHIFIKITNDSNEGKTVNVAAGTGFAQGIFLEYGITEDDDATAVRNGGLGSTTKK